MPSDIVFIQKGDRFYIKAETAEGRRWYRRVVSSDAESFSVEFLAEYKAMVRLDGLSWEEGRTDVP